MDDGYDAENMIIAECKVNLILHSGSRAIVHNNFVRNTWISALARPTCTDCYTLSKIEAQNTICKDQTGVLLHVTTHKGESFPWLKNPFSYDVICVAPNAFSSSFLNDVEFNNFKETYEN